MLNPIENLHWRYATKKFDQTKEPTNEAIAALFEATRFAPSSFGLQPYTLLVVTDTEKRAQLRDACWGQPQITEAPYLVIFASRTDTTQNDLTAYMHRATSQRGTTLEEMLPWSDVVMGFVDNIPVPDRLHWSGKQAYLALGVLLSAAAHMRIDACPLEGFNVEAFDHILELKEKGLSTAVGVAVGYRDDSDPYASYEKVRKTKEELFIYI
jgi:nitroreductase